MRKLRKLLANLDEYVWRDANTTCWHWTKRIHPNGYGQVTTYPKKVEHAHRATYREAFGPIPDGLQVLHKCDVRDCVNPAHLFLGTNADNVADREAKGRNRVPCGEAHGCAKLTASQVREIRARWDRGDVTQTNLAPEYGVTTGMISLIVRRKNWATI